MYRSLWASSCSTATCTDRAHKQLAAVAAAAVASCCCMLACHKRLVVVDVVVVEVTRCSKWPVLVVESAVTASADTANSSADIGNIEKSSLSRSPARCCLDSLVHLN